MSESAAESVLESRLFGALLGGRLKFIRELPNDDIAALDQAGAGASDILLGAGLDAGSNELRQAFAAGMIAGASDLSDTVRLGIIRGLISV
jgi:hypothetical protein